MPEGRARVNLAPGGAPGGGHRPTGDREPGGGRRLLVLALGNDILSDDAVGLEVARRARATWDARAARAEGGGADVEAQAAAVVEFREASLSGLALLDVLAGFDAAVIVDAVELPRTPAGTVLEYDDLGQLTAPPQRLASVHDVALPAALEFGRRLGMVLPRRVAVVAVQVKDARTFGERLSPEVAAAVPAAADRVLDRIRRWLED
jgi:hydrogenase maturation protease